MKQHILMVFLVLLAALSAQGCVEIGTVTGSGKIAKEERQVSGFTGVDLETIGKLYVELGDEEKLVIEAEDNLLEYFEVRVRGGTLRIRSKEGVGLAPTEPVYFYLTARELSSVAISGAGSIEASSLEAGRFSASISGDGNMDVGDLNADVLEANISGLGSLSIAGGEVEKQEIVISGDGNYRARGLESGVADVDVSGLGSTTIRVRDHLDVTISGDGSVEYIGSPTVVQDISGVGHVEKIGD